MFDPPRWTSEELDKEGAKATENFRKARLEEPLEDYVKFLDAYRGDLERLFDTTIDLTDLSAAWDLLTVARLRDAFRYLAGPPISEDDLKTVCELTSFNARRLQADPDAIGRVVRVIRTALDRRRFPWVVANLPPTDAEKNAALLASAALMATQRVGTSRRNQGKTAQEDMVEGALSGIGLAKVERRRVSTFADAPAPGEFCGEAEFGNRKADFLVRLWDQRVMAIECKVSNSAINSVKRLNNDAAAKAEAWRKDFGERHVVPAAVLSGVFKLRHLGDAQRRGLTIFWAHDLASMTSWIERTRT